MRLKILSIYEKGDASKEYVFLEVIDDCDTGEYAIADTTYYPGGRISCELRHFFWFPSKSVKKGERIVLRTGIGKDDSYIAKSGAKIHRFFWGLKSAVWNDSGDAAVLFKMADWATTQA